MAVYGLTDLGFIIQTRDEIRTELEEEFRLEFGKSLPLGNKSALGFLIGLVADRLGSLWEIEQSNYDMMNPDSARKAALVALCLLTGTFKQSATSTVAVETLCGDDATVVGTGTTISATSNGRRFATVEPATLVLLADWAVGTAYILGDRVKNAGFCFQCVTAGTSAGAGPGPNSDTTGITDNTVTWDCIGTGEAAADVVVGCLDSGDIFVAALDIAEIETPVGGLETARNLADGINGREEDTDEQLRIRRETDLSTPGTGPVDSIRAALLAITGVESVTIFHNPGDTTDADGLPPHSIEALVRGGDDADIWQALWDNVSAGVQTHGDEVGTVTDSQGRSQTLRFTRPTEIPIFISVTLVKDPFTYPADGDAQVKAAIAAWGSAQLSGKDVVSSAILARVFDVEGVLSVSLPLVGTVDPPVATTTIPISLRQLATYDTTDIDVTTSDGTP